MVDVPDVEGELLVPGDGVASVDLRPAGHAGLHFHAPGLEGVVALQVAHEERARADDAHVAEEDVPHLRKLVEGGGAQELAEGSQAHGVGQERAVRSARVGHGTELHHAEGTPAQARTLLDEEHGGAEAEPDEQRDGKHQGQEEHQPPEGEDDVKEALGHSAQDFGGEGGEAEAEDLDGPLEGQLILDRGGVRRDDGRQLASGGADERAVLGTAA